MKEEEEPSLLFLLLAHHETKNLRRTIHVRLLGKDYYFCSRCTGKYSGALAVFVLLLTGLQVPAWLHLLIMTFFPLPSTIDWLTQTMGMRESKNWLRILTGHLLGIAWGLLFLSLISGRLGLNLIESGDIDNGLLSVGQVVGLIHDIPTVKELIDRIVKEAEEVASNIGAGGLFKPLRKPVDINR